MGFRESTNYFGGMSPYGLNEAPGCDLDRAQLVPMVNRLIGTAFSTVKFVADNMDYVRYLADNIPVIVPWKPNTIYTAIVPASVITYQNSTYICIVSHTSGSSFDPAKWSVIASKGALGIAAQSLPMALDPAILAAPASQNNLANPDVTDVALTNTLHTDQIYSVWNGAGGSGVWSGQLPDALPTLAATRRYGPLAANTTYTFSIFGAPSSFQFHLTDSPFINFYNSAGTYLSTITAGFTVSVDKRMITFQTPNSGGPFYVPVNLVDSNASASVPMTQAALDSCLSNLMLNVGSTALPFTKYYNGVFTPTTALFISTRSNLITVVKQVGYTYVRANAQNSPNFDIVWRYCARNPAGRFYTSPNHPNALDTQGVRFIPKSTTSEQIIAAFNTSTMYHSAGTDEACPRSINHMFVGGNHGVLGYSITATAHGKVQADVGSIYTDAASLQWVLTYVQDANTVFFTLYNPGSPTTWSFPGVGPTGSVLTHVSGGGSSNVAIAGSVQAQITSLTANYTFNELLDNVPLTADGVYTGKAFVANELYSVLNPASQQASLVANVGASSPNYGAGVEQLRVFNQYFFSGFGSLSILAGEADIQAYTRSAGVPGDYWSALQLQRVTRTTDTPAGWATRVELFVPKVGTVGGYNFSAFADITDNVAGIPILASAATTPVSHFCQRGKLLGAVTSGEVFGYDPSYGEANSTVRLSKITTSLFISGANKLYPIATDAKSGNGVAGTVRYVCAFRAPFLPTDPQLDVPGVVVTNPLTGKNLIFITAHQSLVNRAIALPAGLDGLPITVIDSDGVASISGTQYVLNQQLVVSIRNYGNLVLQAG